MKWIVVLFGLLIATTAWAGEIKVSMAGGSYAPETLSARLGDTVVFTNDDAVEHNIFIPTRGHAADFGRQKPGETVSLSLRKAGAFDIECAIHEGMSLNVEVSQ